MTGDAVLVLLTDASADYRALVSLDSTLERVRWRVSAPKPWSTSRAFVWHDTVVLGSGPDVTAYSLADGSRVWSRTVSGSVRSIGASDDMLFESTRQGTLYAFRR